MAGSRPQQQKLALVVVNKQFVDDFDVNVSAENVVRTTRLAATEDDVNLQRVFKEILEFDLIFGRTFMNLKAHTFGETWPFFIHYHQNDKNVDECNCLCCYIRKSNPSNLDCFLLVISSHGARVLGNNEMVQEIEFSDTNRVTLADIIEALSDTKCKNLIGVPRVIILDVCRSDPDFPRKDLLDDQGVPLELVKSSETTDLASNFQSMKVENKSAEDTEGRGKTESRTTNVPAAQTSESRTGRVEPDLKYVFEFPEKTLQNLPKDFLVVFSSYANKKSYHDVKRGSWMIEELKKVVEEHNFLQEPQMNFLNILAKVSGRVALNREGKHGQKQAVTIYHRLTKPIIFTKKEVKEHISNPEPASFH